MTENSGFSATLTGGREVNVSSAERMLSALGGGALTAHGLKRGGVSGMLEALLGAALLQRGATGHCTVYDALGVSTAPEHGAAERLPERRTVHVERAFTIQRPAEELYRFWRQLDNLPQFMKHLESVRVLNDTRSHWVAKAPAGLHTEWEAEITADEPGERIAWKSVEGSDVANAGEVRFHSRPDDKGTEVHVSLTYAPPAGKVGVTIAKLFREAPEQQIRDDLRHFKQIMETGEVPTTAGQPAGPR